jgi:hypothetical protein
VTAQVIVIVPENAGSSDTKPADERGRVDERREHTRRRHGDDA